MPSSRLSTKLASLRMLVLFHFLSLHMWALHSLIVKHRLNLEQLIPDDIKYDPNATPPQFTNNEDSIIEVGTHVRVKLIGTRAEVGTMYAIASIKEDYLG
jgi:hypothetical protein